MACVVLYTLPKHHTWYLKKFCIYYIKVTSGSVLYKTPFLKEYSPGT